jgi:glutamate N-acetyltransferase/amino-acid N-acetyltransferase
MAGNAEITEKGEDYAAFLEALQTLCMELAKMMAVAVASMAIDSP